MDTPAVRYATTSDGISIAWAEAGEGPALLYCGFVPFMHLQETAAVFDAYFDTLAGSFRLIRFDARGTGMSERDVANVSTDTLLSDVEAVIAAAKLDRFVVIADNGLLALWTALQLATVLPERVTHLALEAPFQNMRELADTPYGRLGLPLAEADWSIFVATFLRVLAGWAEDSAWVDPYAKAAAGWVDPSLGRQYLRLNDGTDVSDLLPGIRQPTLILRLDPNPVPARSCQRLAARIPGAQFRQYADPTGVHQAELIRDFVGRASRPSMLLPDRAVAAPAAGSSSPSLLGARGRAASASRTILYTDIEGNTDMLQRLGDDAWRAVLRDHERITRELLHAHDGAEVKTMGDGFIASFDSATSAVECAIGLQRAFASRNEKASEPVTVRVGLNAGEPIAEDDDLFGTAVTMAARIMGQGAGGEILASDVVRALVAGKGFVFGDRGEFVPKGFDEGVRLWDVRWQE